MATKARPHRGKSGPQRGDDAALVQAIFHAISRSGFPDRYREHLHYNDFQSAHLMGGFLIVDDDVTLARSLGRFLGTYGDTIAVHTCADAEQALERDLFSGVVLDMRLPDGDGIDVLQRMRARGDTTAALVMTADTRDSVHQRVARLAAAFCEKPPVPSLIRDFARDAADPAHEGRRLERQLHLHDETLRWLGRELHDGIAQDLADLLVRLALAQREQRIDALAPIRERVRAMADEVRRLAHGIHPSTMLAEGLGSALRCYLEGIGARHELVVTHSLPADSDRWSDEVRIGLFRIAQEATQNALVHAFATHLHVELRVGTRATRLSISDDGHGFDVTRGTPSSPRGARGLGLRSMHERAELLGGRCVVTSTPSGTMVRVQVPTPRSRSDH